MDLQPYQQRVIEEHHELEERRSKLLIFLGTEQFKALPGAEQERMARQFDYMTGYAIVLRERIEAFST